MKKSIPRSYVPWQGAASVHLIATLYWINRSEDASLRAPRNYTRDGIRVITEMQRNNSRTTDNGSGRSREIVLLIQVLIWMTKRDLHYTTMLNIPATTCLLKNQNHG